MSEESRVEAAPQPQGQRLTLRRVRMILIWQLCSTLLTSGLGIYLLADGSKIGAAACCLGSVVSAASLATIWKQYRRVRSGDIVIVQPQGTSQLVRVHPTVSIVVMSLMTLMVLTMSGVTLYVSPHMTRASGLATFLVGFNAFLWLLTGYLWYRVATERQKITVVEPFYEQGEGVWPPAPQVPTIK